MHRPAMGQTLCQIVKHVDALQHTLAQLNKQFLLPAPISSREDLEGQEPIDRALTVIEHTADGEDDPAENKHSPAGPIEFTSSSIHNEAQDYEDRERIACFLVKYGVEGSWYPATIHGRAISYPQPLAGPEPMTGMTPYRSLPLPPSPQAQTLPAEFKAEQSKATVQDESKGRSHSAPITGRLRSLSWYEILGYESEPVPGPITWEESAEDDVCIEGTGPFWSGKYVSIEGYTDGRRASLITSIDRRERSAVWETELRVFQQTHELERARKEVTQLKERIKDLQAAGRMYRDKLTMSIQDIEYVKEQWRRDKDDFLAARGYIERLEMQWRKDYTELLIARDYITELEETEVQCECWKKRKWEPEAPGSTKKAKADVGNARRNSYDGFWAAQESRRSVSFFLTL
ncbi:hypothetical protein BDW67DRAFT_161435 [Aspergillus spinulosporus]